MITGSCLCGGAAEKEQESGIGAKDMYRDALSRAMLQKDKRVLGGAATRRRAGARAAFPLPRGDATSRARARRGNAVRGAYSFQTMHGHGLFKRVWCCVVLRGKAAQWRIDAPEMGNVETPGCNGKLMVC